MERIRISWRQTVFVMAALVLAFGLAGCEMITGALNGGDSGGSKAEPVLTLTPPSVTIGVAGSGKSLTATILVTAKDKSGNLESFDVVSTDEGAVKVTKGTASFVVTAVGANATPIDVSVSSASGKVAILKVTVADAKPVVPVNTPTGVTATKTASAGYRSIDLTWNDATSQPASASDVFKYNVQRKEGATGAFSTIASNLDATGYVDSLNIKASTTYYYKVQAVRTSDSVLSPWTTTAVSVTTDAAPIATAAPSVPTGLTAGSATASTLDLTWASDTNATSWDIQKKVTSAATWTTVSNITSNAYTVTGLSPSTGYDFQVRASNSFGTSSWTATVPATTTAAAQQSNTVTGKPVLSLGTVYATSVQILWSGVTGATKYEIQKVNSTGGVVAQLADNFVGFSFTDSNALSASTTYYYQVRGKNDTGGTSGTGLWSDIFSATTAAAVTGGIAKPTTAPSLSIGSVDSSSVQLRWQAVANATAYDLYYSVGAGTGWIGPQTVYNGTTFTFFGLTPSTTYQFKAKAWNSSGSGPESTSVTAMTTVVVVNQKLPPPVPMNFSVYNSSGHAAMSWAMSNGASGYYVYRLDPGYSDVPENYGYIGATDAFTTYFTDMQNLIGGNMYRYKVQAWNAYGVSDSMSYAFNAPYTGTGLLPPSVYSSSSYIDPTQPNNSWIEIDWNYVPNAMSYKLEASTDGVNWTTQTSGITWNYYYFYGMPGFGLVPATTYSYRVTVYDYNGGQATSSVFTYTTPAVSAQPVPYQIYIN